jgi:CheY-like chemotaxis protein
VDGLEFLRRLRARDDSRSTPVAIVTGDYFLDDTIPAQLRDLGAEVRFKSL